MNSIVINIQTLTRKTSKTFSESNYYRYTVGALYHRFSTVDLTQHRGPSEVPARKLRETL